MHAKDLIHFLKDGCNSTSTTQNRTFRWDIPSLYIYIPPLKNYRQGVLIEIRLNKHRSVRKADARVNRLIFMN